MSDDFQIHEATVAELRACLAEDHRVRESLLHTDGEVIAYAIHQLRQYREWDQRSRERLRPLSQRAERAERKLDAVVDACRAVIDANEADQ